MRTDWTWTGAVAVAAVLDCGVFITRRGIPCACGRVGACARVSALGIDRVAVCLDHVRERFPESIVSYAPPIGEHLLHLSPRDAEYLCHQLRDPWRFAYFDRDQKIAAAVREREELRHELHMMSGIVERLHIRPPRVTTL